MVLGFMQKFPWGEPTYFIDKIIGRVEPKKIHTIRVGNRWKPGMKIHMAQGVRTKHYTQFNKGIWDLETVKGVQRIDIIHRGQDCCIIFIDRKIFYSRLAHTAKNQVDEIFDKTKLKEHNREGFLEFIANDGLTEEQFWKYFANRNIRNGQIVHWTDFRYQ